MRTMDMDTAPAADRGECPICGEEAYVDLQYEDVCSVCGHVPGGFIEQNEESEWESWHEHRHENYDGFYGDDRVKFVGSFTYEYDN